MTLSRPVKILIGIGTAATLLFPLFLFAVLFAMAFSFSFTATSENPSGVFAIFPLFFAVIFPVQCLVILLQMGLQAFYLVHIIKNTVASDTTRAILGVGIFFLPYIAMPIYYLLFVWPEHAPTGPIVPGSSLLVVDGGPVAGA